MHVCLFLIDSVLINVNTNNLLPNISYTISFIRFYSMSSAGGEDVNIVCLDTYHRNGSSQGFDFWYYAKNSCNHDPATRLLLPFIPQAWHSICAYQMATTDVSHRKPENSSNDIFLGLKLTQGKTNVYHCLHLVRNLTLVTRKEVNLFETVVSFSKLSNQNRTGPEPNRELEGNNQTATSYNCLDLHRREAKCAF